MIPGTRPTVSAAGFTMVELLIAMSLLVIAIVPVTSVLWSGLRAAAASSHHTDAFSIAARETEGLHADPYALIGFYSDQSAAAWKTSTTVIVAGCSTMSTSCTTPSAPLILPVSSTFLAGVTYTIAHFVYWADAQGISNTSTSTTFSQAYKGTTVTVSWTDNAGSHTVEQDSAIYPGGRGVYTGPGGAASTTTTSTAPLVAPGTPALALAASQPASPQNQQEIDLVITAPPSGGAIGFYYVQWSTDPTFVTPQNTQQSLQLPATSTSYAALGLAAATTYSFRMFAGNATGQSGYSTPVVSATTAAIPVTTTTTVPTSTTVPATTTTTLACSLGAFTINTVKTGKTYLHNGNGKMTENVVLNLAINGACPVAVTVNSVLHGTTTPDPDSPPYALTGPAGGGQWSFTIASNGQSGWSVGTHDMTVYLAGRATAVSHGLLICAATGSPSLLATTC